MGAGVSTEGAPLTRVKCKNNLGVLFDPKAEEAFHAAATGPDDELTVPYHPEVAGTLSNLGNAYRDLGDYAKARDVLERALAINERTYGRDHPEVAGTLSNLGCAYMKEVRRRAMRRGIEHMRRI